VVAGGMLFLTHSGASSDKVTVWSVGNNAPVPEYFNQVTVGFNPFGLGYAP
jgi:hypothetical protein